MTKLNFFNPTKKNLLKFINLVLIFSLIISWFATNSVKTQAANTAFNGGQISLNKYYVNGLLEVKSLITAPGDTITVRLKYNNTSSVSSINTVLSDSLPDPKFSYLPGTLKNCLINSSNCLSLNDSLFSGSNLVLNPLAGYFGYSNNSVSGNLEFGKKLFLHTTTCNQTNNDKESFIQLIDNSSLYVPSCSATGGSVLNYSNFNLLGNRYLHQSTCNQANGQKEIFVQAVNNSSSFTPECGILGNTLSASETIDLLGNRYLHQSTCNQANGQKEIFVQAVNNSSSFTPDCGQLPGASVDSGTTFDLYFASNNGGYIEYQMKSNIVEDYQSNDNIDLGTYGSSPSFSSDDFTTLVDPMQNSIAIKIFCDTISPVGAIRNLTLTDAELRTGQDFRCNYQASICPIVFDDLNSNGRYDLTDNLTSGVQVLLQTVDGLQTIDTLTTTNSSTCFSNLSHGRNYRVTISSPPPGASSTGGNTQFQQINYLDTEVQTFFGYANGNLILNVPDLITLPTLTVASTETFSQTEIRPIQVIDTRLSNPGWTLTATVDDFVARNQNTLIIPVSGAFRNTPTTITANSGQTTGLGIGDQKIVNSITDSLSIFSASPGASQGNYEIGTDIRLTVPPFTRSANYQTRYTYTII